MTRTRQQHRSGQCERLDQPRRTRSWIRSGVLVQRPAQRYRSRLRIRRRDRQEHQRHRWLDHQRPGRRQRSQLAAPRHARRGHALRPPCAQSAATASRRRRPKPSRLRLTAPTRSARSAALRTASGTRTGSSQSCAVATFFRVWRQPPRTTTSRHSAPTSSYTINGAGPADIDAPRGDTTSIPITGEGQKELRFSPVDLAGNKAAAKVATFGIDATNPNGYIDRPDAARPTLLSSKLTDAPSGVSYAIFSVRPTGGI